MGRKKKSPAPDTPQPDETAEGRARLYQGTAGQMAIMSEFLYRLMNVAQPQVDIGDDIFVVRERDETVTRVQAKYSRGEDQQNGTYYALFSLPWGQFSADDFPPLVYVFAVRHRDRWSDFIVIRRSVLWQLQGLYEIGSVARDRARNPVALSLRLVFDQQAIRARNAYDLRRFHNAFLPWPPPQWTQPTTEEESSPL